MLLATTTVEDFDRFTNVFSTKGAEKRRQHGSKGAVVFHDPNEADRVWVIFDWDLDEYPLTHQPDFGRAWDFSRPIGDYFHPFSRTGRRVTRRDLEPDDWHAWNAANR